MEENDITPPDEPEFPQLKDRLNKETEDFLVSIHLIMDVIFRTRNTIKLSH